MSRYGKMLDISVRTDISSIPSGWRERRCAQVDIEYRGVAMVNQVVGKHGGAQGGFYWLTKCVNHGNYTIFQIARTRLLCTLNLIPTSYSGGALPIHQHRIKGQGRCRCVSVINSCLLPTKYLYRPSALCIVFFCSSGSTSSSFYVARK